MNEKIGCLECLKHAFMRSWCSPVCVTHNGRFANISVDTMICQDKTYFGGKREKLYYIITIFITKIDKYVYIIPISLIRFT